MITKVKNSFIMKLIFRTNKNELYYIASELTVKILIATLPFLMFLLGVLGSFELNLDLLVPHISKTIPDEVLSLLGSFINSISIEEGSSFVPFTLLLALFSASSGFVSVIRGINKTYEIEDKRNFIYIRLISMIFVFLFTITIFISMLVLIYGSSVFNLMMYFDVLVPYVPRLNTISNIFLMYIFVTLAIMSIYKISANCRIKFISTLPGALFTVFFWRFSSLLYKVYIDNFSNYSAIYGTIGSLLIFIYWLYIFSFVLLVGSQINSILTMDSYYPIILKKLKLYKYTINK